MSSKDSVRNMISQLNAGQKIPALQLVKTNPEIAAAISKLIKPRDSAEFDFSRKESYYNLNQSQIQAISDSIKTRIIDNENILQLFPDIELAVQILVSSILSPKDMVKTDLIYKAKEPILPSELILKLNQIVTSHFENYYNIKDELQTILRDTLFDTGSYVKTVIPESIVDQIINNNARVSTESLSELFKDNQQAEHLGLLGNPGAKESKIALERFALNGRVQSYNPYPSLEDGQNKITINDLEITDNYKLLKLPKIIEAHNKQKVKNLLKGNKVTLESLTDKKKLSNHEFSSLLYKDNRQETDTFVVIPSSANAKRKSVGRPLVMRLPSESVIPVYVPGDESHHIGYFVLVDIDGNPVTVNTNLEQTQGLSGMLNNGQGQNTSLSSLLIQKAKRNLASNDQQVTIDQITKVYSSIIENDLVERLNNGLYGSNVAVANNEIIYRIMLARALSSKFTRLIFIPAELTTYFAFKYCANGVGKSYLDDLKVLTSLRAILLFAKIMAQTKNAIALTHVNMTLDPNDPDPVKTIEMSMHEIVKLRQQYFPLGINSPADLVDWIQRAGLEFSFEGHPGIPQTKFDFESKQMQHTIPDTELDETLRKQTYMALGLSPEVVDNGFNSEFATTVISNNILLSKRVIQLQQTFTRQLTDYCRKVITHDKFAFDELLDVLQENKGLVEKSLTDDEKQFFKEDSDKFYEDLIERYLDNLEIDLPKPDITTIETQMDAFEKYIEALDKAIEAWLSSEILPNDFIGQLNGNIDSLKSIIRAHFLRQWMSENGFMSELNDIVTSDEDGAPTLDIYNICKNHTEGIMRSATNFIKNLLPAKTATDKDLENMNVESGAGGDSYSSDNSDTGENDGGFGFGDGSNDLNLETGGENTDQNTSEETPPEEEKPESETPEAE